MKKTLMIILAIITVSFLGMTSFQAQSLGGGYGGGMGGGYYSGHGGGMMDYDEGMVPYSSLDNHQDRSGYEKLQRQMQEREAREIVGNHIGSTSNPNQKVGKIEDMGPNFQAEIIAKDGSLLDKVSVHKNGGSMRSLY